MSHVAITKLLGLKHGRGGASGSIKDAGSFSGWMKRGYCAQHKNSLEHYALHPTEILWLAGPAKRRVAREAAARLGVAVGPVDAMNGPELTRHVGGLLRECMMLLKSESKVKV